MAKSIPPIIKHQNCECKIVQGPFGPHAGKVICVEHNAFVQWLPKIPQTIIDSLKEKSNDSKTAQ